MTRDASGAPEPSRTPEADRALDAPDIAVANDALDSLTRQLQALRDEALAAIAGADSPEALERISVRFLGRKGELTALLRGIGGLRAEERPRGGQVANEVRERVETALAERQAALADALLAARFAEERVDPTLPGRPLRRGTLHPVLETIRRIAEVFGQFGFVVYESPQVETDELNFQLLNMPPEHPARDLWDTLYTDAPGYLLRTHTSPGQIHVMRKTKPPIRALLPGRCFRYEAVDPSHGFEFFQVEGLMVDEGTTLADLRGLLDEFAHALFGPRRPTRFRPGYYPFTEPSVAFDVRCVVCDGAGCPACKRTGWMTILGAGMVHPLVLRNGGIDPERYQGFAFGMGADRITMLRHGIRDLRYFFQADVRFLEQF